MTKIPYVTFMKHAQKITKATSSARPVLKGVIHRDNYIAVTDSHRLYFASDAYEGEEKNVNPVTGEELTDGNYPEVFRLIPDPDSAHLTVKLDVDKASKAIKLIESAGKIDKASDFVVIERDTTVLVLSTHTDSIVDCRYTAAQQLSNDEPIKITASAKYVSEAFALLKDAGFTEVSFNYFGNFRPFTFTGGNLTVLILPIRTN